MRTIAVIKNCTEDERNKIISATNSDDKVLFFDTDNDLLNYDDLNSIDIAFGEPDLSTVEKLKNLRWIQMSWAGANKYISSEGLFRNITLTSASGAYGGVIAEYIIAGMLSLYRNMFKYRTDMMAGKWERIDLEDSIEGKRALVLGTGDIGSDTARKLKSFDAYVVGLCRTKRESLQYFDEVYTIDHLEDEIKKADVVIIALPGTKETAGLFDARIIGMMKKDAMLVNIGRGFIVNTEALTEALKNGDIAAAVLDVTDPEPLPSDHPLRKMENVVLTPHISGIGWGTNMHTRNKILDIFCENIKLDNKGEALRNIIDFNKGY